MNRDELLDLKRKILKTQDLCEINNLFPKMSAYSYLYECNKNRLDCYALNYFGRKYTFREFFDKVDTIAKALVEKYSIKQGDIVSVSMLNTPEGVMTFYALNKIGAVAHMVNIVSDPKKIKDQIEATNSKLYILLDIFYNNKTAKILSDGGIENVVTTSLTDSFPLGFYNSDKMKYELIKIIKNFGNCELSSDKCTKWQVLEKIGKKSTLNIIPCFKPNEPVAIAYTSGSTGEAKAVVATNEAMNAMPVQLGMTDQTFAPNDSIFSTLPLWIYYSLENNIHNPLCLGVTVDMDPLFDSKKIAKRIKQYRFNHWNTIPAYVEDMADSKDILGMNLSHLKSITTGGDFLTNVVKSKADSVIKEGHSDVRVGQGYGASEILGSFGYTYEVGATQGSIGKPLVGNQFKIINLDTGNLAGINETGELYLFSPSLMKEYYKNPEATSECLVKDDNDIMWYKTGDLAHYNEKGELFIDGRIRRIVMALDNNGQPTKIFPDKIKKVILQDKNVEKCEVITVPDETHIKKSIAYIVLKNSVLSNRDAERSIQALCMNQLEKYMQPAEYKFITEIPIKASLKVDIDALEKMYSDENQQKHK